ncbi:MAG TPA: HAMP domain-containing sensor histidine kinase [Polyangiaceae bacterium]|nr:HAMP domain-containing sensor histidine kinase [Polyangiaceae bacterium]
MLAGTVTSPSLVTRVARRAALAASCMALLAAVVASAVGALLLVRAEDRRLREAGLVLVVELGTEPLSPARVQANVQHEHEEVQHAGIRFAVASIDGALVAGDAHLSRPPVGECGTDAPSQVRACSVASANGLVVTASALQALETPVFMLAALVASALAALVTGLWSRPVARGAIAPLTRLRARVAAIDVETSAAADLGPAERVVEVDELRTAMALLIERLARALEQAQSFAANAAHELRTPLTAVSAELELLSEAHAPSPTQTAAPPAESNLSTIQAKLGELHVLVDRLLILAAPKSILTQPHEIVSLRDVVEDVVRGLPTDERERVELTEADALVRGDAVLLSTMFANGLGNALKFGHRARVSLTLGAGRARLDIRDDGPGLDASLRERVFEPFFRDDRARRDRVPGHGLGLALIRHVAESHGGTARFIGEAPGACLSIDLPELVR